MSELPNAPLLEVVFELKWKITNQNDLKSYQYLPGDVYDRLKGEYPERMPLFPPDVPVEVYINKPAHRFKSKNGYPLIQVGPGLVTLNTVDEVYYWEVFSKKATELVSTLMEVFNAEKPINFQPQLAYIDFYEYDFLNGDILNFIQKNLHLSIQQDFHKFDAFPDTMDLTVTYGHELGKVLLKFNTAKNQSGKDGLVVQIKIIGDSVYSVGEPIIEWLEASHSLSRSIFRNMTKGDLFESFQ